MGLGWAEAPLSAAQPPNKSGKSLPMPERRGEREGIGVLAPKPEILAPLLLLPTTNPSLPYFIYLNRTYNQFTDLRLDMVAQTVQKNFHQFGQ